MRDFLTALIECSLSMSALVLGLLALTPWLSKRYAAKWLYYVWLVVVIGLIVPFRFHPAVALIPMNAASSSIQQTTGETTRITTDPAVQTGIVRQGLPAIPWYQVAGCFWIAGAIAFIVYHGWKHHRFVGMVRRWGERVDDPQILNVLCKIEHDMSITGRAELYVCSCVSSPMMIGFLHPVILLPRVDFSADELSCVLRHELVHFQRRDLWYKSLVLLATAIHWFNPVVYLMAQTIASQCEISCDAEVVNGTDVNGRQQYSQTILRTVKQYSRLQTVFSTNFYGSRNDMKNRIVSIMDTTKKRTGAVVMCLVLLGTLGLGMIFAAPGHVTAVASSLLSAWQTEQESTVSDGEKVRSTVDTYFSMGYADRMSTSFVPRTALFGTAAGGTSGAQTGAQYADASLKYNILCWQTQGYVPTSYTYAPHYDRVTVEESGLTATATLEPICDLYFASRSVPDRTGSEKHVITLQKQNGTWQIMNDMSNTDSVSYPAGTNFDELAATFPARFATWKMGQAQLAAQAQIEASTMKQNADPRFQLLDPQKSAPSMPRQGNIS